MEATTLFEERLERGAFLFIVIGGFVARLRGVGDKTTKETAAATTTTTPKQTPPPTKHESETETKEYTHKSEGEERPW